MNQAFKKALKQQSLGKLGAVRLLDMKIKLPIATTGAYKCLRHLYAPGDKYAASQVKADGGVLNTSIQLCPGLP